MTGKQARRKMCIRDRYVFVNHLWYPAGPDGRPRPGSVGTKTKPRPPRRGGGGFGEMCIRDRHSIETMCSQVHGTSSSSRKPSK